MANWNKVTSRGKVDDRRGVSAAGISGAGVTGILLLMGVTYLMGGNPLDVLNQVDINQLQTPTIDSTEFDGDDSYEQFASAVLGSNNDFWSIYLTKQNITYQEPTLVLFRNSTQSYCGGADSASGPHYCPADQTIYLDETFFDELTNTLGAQGGDVAQAYVIAHEVGHHIQNLQDTISTSQNSNQDSINIELQADCFAGLWAGSIKEMGIFAPGEINEAIDAAAAVGDDHIQETMGQTVQPDAWTHGSSAQRQQAFEAGYDGSTINDCNF